MNQQEWGNSSAGTGVVLERWMGEPSGYEIWQWTINLSLRGGEHVPKSIQTWHPGSTPQMCRTEVSFGHCCSRGNAQAATWSLWHSKMLGERVASPHQGQALVWQHEEWQHDSVGPAHAHKKVQKIGLSLITSHHSEIWPATPFNHLGRNEPWKICALFTIWLFNIAMERSTILKNGKPSFSMGHCPWLC